jgi:hypothetical protein
MEGSTAAFFSTARAVDVISAWNKSRNSCHGPPVQARFRRPPQQQKVLASEIVLLVSQAGLALSHLPVSRS